MQTPWDCLQNDTKEVPLNSVQKCLDLICCKKTSFFSWTWSLSQILKAGPWKCLNLIQAKISNVQENIPFVECGHYLKFWRCLNLISRRKYQMCKKVSLFLNVGIISNFGGVPLKVFESHLQVKISNVQENILFSKNWALSHILNADPWKCLNLICWMKVSNVQEIILFL